MSSAEGTSRDDQTAASAYSLLDALGKLDLALYVLRDVPSNTASAMTLDDWRQAWVETWQRANRAEVAVDEIEEEVRSRMNAVVASHGVGEMSEQLATLLAFVTERVPA